MWICSASYLGKFKTEPIFEHIKISFQQDSISKSIFYDSWPFLLLVSNGWKPKNVPQKLNMPTFIFQPLDNFAWFFQDIMALVKLSLEPKRWRSKGPNIWTLVWKLKYTFFLFLADTLNYPTLLKENGLPMFLIQI